MWVKEICEFRTLLRRRLKPHPQFSGCATKRDEVKKNSVDMCGHETNFVGW